MEGSVGKRRGMTGVSLDIDMPKRFIVGITTIPGNPFAQKPHSVADNI
jgi:hypothetical protein